MEYTVIEHLVKEYVSTLYTNSAPPYLVYHNLSHTEHVVKHAVEVADYYKLDDRAHFILVAAGWFEMDIHEQASVEIWKDLFVMRIPGICK